MRDARNPIRGFDLHKPTLYRVTRGRSAPRSSRCQRRWPKGARAGGIDGRGGGEIFAMRSPSCQPRGRSRSVDDAPPRPSPTRLIVHFVVEVFFYRAAPGIRVRRGVRGWETLARRDKKGNETRMEGGAKRTGPVRSGNTNYFVRCAVTACKINAIKYRSVRAPQSPLGV